jgi:hypothetical protein
MIEKISNHVERAKKNLMSQYKDSVKFNQLLQALVEELQEIEDVFWDLYTLRYISTAFGYQLDRIGDTVGVVRYGLDDNQYRKRIYSQIILNASNGEAEILIRSLKLLMNATIIEYTEYKYEIIITFRSDESDPFLYSQMQKLCLAGIKKIFLYQDFSDTKFIFAERYLEDFNLVVGVNKDKIIVDSQGLEYNVLLSTGEVTEPSPFDSLSDKFTVEGQEVVFIGGRLMERLNK